jgi:two-component system sensor histidine kinase YesM
MKDDEGGNLISFVHWQPRCKKGFIPLDSLYKEISDLRLWMIVFCIATVIILSLISRIIAFDLIKPIKLLVDGMKKVQKGKTVGVKVDRNDELGFITKSFNEMANEIEHLITWIYREQITRKEAQLKALQSQINPHFLFNTLESINWMAQLNNVPEISETVTAFSSLMEASIGRDDKLITLREELTYIDNYISILKKRFEDGIQLIKHIETEKILEINIPRLLIQPLIENAVYHGIDRSSRTGIINLNVYTKEDILFIEVMDNGMGIDEEELRILNKNLSMDNDTYFRTHVNKDRKSIGMENVNRRIKLFYGERFGIKIESETGEYTKVVVSIPANTAEADGGSAEETGPRDL